MSSMFAEPLRARQVACRSRHGANDVGKSRQREGLRPCDPPCIPARGAWTRRVHTSSTANSFIGHLDHFSKQLEPLLTRRPQDDGTLHVARRVRNRSRLIRRLMHRRTREAASEHAYSFADRYGYLRRLVSPRAQQLPRARAHRARTKSSRFRPLRFVFPRPRFLAAKTCRAPAITHEDRRAEPFSATRDGAHALRAITH